MAIHGRYVGAASYTKHQGAVRPAVESSAGGSEQVILSSRGGGVRWMVVIEELAKLVEQDVLGGWIATGEGINGVIPT